MEEILLKSEDSDITGLKLSSKELLKTVEELLKTVGNLIKEGFNDELIVTEFKSQSDHPKA